MRILPRAGVDLAAVHARFDDLHGDFPAERHDLLGEVKIAAAALADFFQEQVTGDFREILRLKVIGIHPGDGGVEGEFQEAARAHARRAVACKRLAAGRADRGGRDIHQGK
jgi:hypothetical protein